MRLLSRLKKKAVLFCAAKGLLLNKRGQATAEYLLMLTFVVGMLITFGNLFHTQILKFFFIIVGMTISGAVAS